MKLQSSFIFLLLVVSVCNGVQEFDNKQAMLKKKVLKELVGCIVIAKQKQFNALWNLSPRVFYNKDGLGYSGILLNMYNEIADLANLKSVTSQDVSSGWQQEYKNLENLVASYQKKISN